MSKSFEKEFIFFCEDQDLEVNINQINVIKKLEQYYQINFKFFFFKIIFKKFISKRILSLRRCWSWKDYDFKFFF